METTEGLNELIKKRLIEKKGNVKLTENNDIVLYGKALGISENQLLFKILDISETIDWNELPKTESNNSESTFQPENIICKNCNAVNEKGVANFCVECGNSLFEEDFHQQSPLEYPLIVETEKSKLPTIFGILALIIIGLLVYFFYFVKNNNSSNENNSEITNDSIQIENIDETTLDTLTEPSYNENIQPISYVNALAIMNRYYADLNSNNLNAENFYSDEVTQFITRKNVTPHEINLLYSQNDEYLDGKSTIINDYLSFERTENDITYFSFWIDYSCFRNKTRRYQYCKVNIEVGFDSNEKISSYKELKLQDLRFEEPNYEEETQDSL